MAPAAITAASVFKRRAAFAGSAPQPPYIRNTAECKVALSRPAAQIATYASFGHHPRRKVPVTGAVRVGSCESAARKLFQARRTV
jgi:hypothetical protein